MIEEEHAAQFKDSMTCAAFVAWQAGRQSGAISEHTGFDKYLKNLGLADGPAPLTPEERKAMAAKAVSKAERISAEVKALLKSGASA